MAVEDYSKEGNFKKVSFPYEWLIMENVKKMKEIELTKEAKIQVKSHKFLTKRYF